MSPKEKALELFDNMMQTISDNCEHNSYCSRKECTWKGMTVCVVTRNEAKQCALIAAKQIADECNKYFEAISQNRVNYWVAVKAEIERL